MRASENLYKISRGGKVFALSVFTSAFLIACGGGGGEPGTNPNTGSQTAETKAASIDLTVSSSTIPSGASAASDGVTITALVKNSGNTVLTGQAITFETDYGTLRADSLTTNSETGVATAVLSLPQTATAETRKNRTITVTARSGTITNKVSIDVTGSNLAITGDSTLITNTENEYTVVAKDSAGVEIPSAELKISATSGNVSPSTVTTDAKGSATFKFTPTSNGSSTITAEGLGVKQSITTTSNTARVQIVAREETWDVNQVNAVVARLIDSSGGIAAIAGQAVKFSTTRGCIYSTQAAAQAADALTANCSTTTVVTADANNTATAFVRTRDIGTATVTTETANGLSGVFTKAIVATIPASLNLQANPSAVRTSDSATNTTSALQARIVDVNGNPVQGATVAFNTESDASGGRISPSTAVTDADGIARSTYFAGSRASGSNAVIVKATYQGANPTEQVVGRNNLTVGGDGITLSIGAANEISSYANNTQYRILYTVYASNSAGGALANQQITVNLTSHGYDTGCMVWSGDANSWVKNRKSPDAGAVAQYPQDAGISTSVAGVYNTRLSSVGNPLPGLFANLVPSDENGTVGNIAPSISLTTNSSGRAYFYLQYAKDYAVWTRLQTNVAATVASTTSRNSEPVHYLIGAAEDYNKQEQSPPGAVSPYNVYHGVTCP